MEMLKETTEDFSISSSTSCASAASGFGRADSMSRTATGSSRADERSPKRSGATGEHSLSCLQSQGNACVLDKEPKIPPSTQVMGAVSDQVATTLSHPVLTSKARNPGQQAALVPLSSSELWKKAFKTVQTDPGWKQYVKVVGKNAAFTGSSVDGPDEIIAVARKLLEQLDAPKSSLKLAGRTVVMVDVLDKTITALAVVKDLGTAVTRLNPDASIAWGCLQFLVQAVVNDRDLRDLCWKELPRMLRLTSRYQTFETLYQSLDLSISGQLHTALISLFSAILRYQMAIVNHLTSRLQRFTTAFQEKAKSLPHKLSDEVEKCETEISRLQALADRSHIDAQFRRTFDLSVSNSEQMVQVAQSLEESFEIVGLMQSRTDAHVDEISKNIEESRRYEILGWISNLKYGNAHNRDQRKAMSGTGAWLTQSSTYVHWRNSESPGVLWLRGFMGSGKSCLAHAVIEDVKKNYADAKNKRIAYFYCDGTSGKGVREASQAVNILRCLLQQLARAESEGKLLDRVIVAWQELHEEGDLTKEHCITLMRNIIDEIEATTFVIDGLDECPVEVQRNLMLSITSILEKCTSTVKLFVSSRYTVVIEDLLRDQAADSMETDVNNQSDIKLLVRSRVKMAKVTPGYRHLYLDAGRNQDYAVASRILDKAGGMFRWVEVAFNFLHNSVDYEAMSHRLEQLSHLGELFDLYDKIYDDMIKQLGQQDRYIITTLLIFMLHGEQPPKQIGAECSNNLSGIAHILQACTFTTGKSIAGSSLEPRRLRALCPSLIVVTNRGSAGVYFPHLSVREWLLERRSEEYSLNKGHSFIAHLCIKVLISSDQHELQTSGTQGSHFAMVHSSLKPSALKCYSFRSWLDHILAISPTVDPMSTSSSGQVELSELQSILKQFLFARQLEILPSKPMTHFQYWQMRLTEEFAKQNPDSFPWEPPRAMANYYRVSPAALSPAIICAGIGHSYDLSKFEDSVFQVHGAPGTIMPMAHWKSRTLALSLTLDKTEVAHWLLRELGPSPRMLADALVFELVLVKAIELLIPEDVKRKSLLDRWIETFVSHGLDLQVQCGKSGKPLLASLVEDNISFCKRGTSTVLPMMVLSLIEHGADPSVSVMQPDTNVRTKDATILDWVLFWGHQPVIEKLHYQFLSLTWPRSVWTGWLSIAVDALDFPLHMIHSILLHGANALDDVNCHLSPLEMAFELPSRVSVLDLLSSMAFAGAEGTQRRMSDRLQWLFFSKVIPNCSLSTIKIWVTNGADFHIEYAPGETAFTKAAEGGRTDVEAYLRSVGGNEASTKSASTTSKGPSSQYLINGERRLLTYAPDGSISYETCRQILQGQPDGSSMMRVWSTMISDEVSEQTSDEIFEQTSDEVSEQTSAVAKRALWLTGPLGNGVL